jgi:signal transduction histidine kinase
MLIIFTSLLLFGRDQILDNVEENFLDYAALIEEADGDSETLDSYNQIFENQEIEYGIFNTQGLLEYPNTDDTIQMDLHSEEEDALADGETLLLRTEGEDLRGNQAETVLIYVPMLSESGNYEGFIGIGRPVSQIEVELDELERNMLQVFLISAIVAVIMSMLLAYYLVKRVNRLSKASQKVATGDYDIYIDHSNRDEIDRLSADFNKMIKSLKEWRREVLHLEERRKTFMQDVAHEMRTPLTTINGLLEGLEYGVFDDEQEMRSIKLMRKETTRLIRLVNENLDYENIQSNHIVLRKNYFPLNDAIEEISEQLSTIADDSNNEIIIAEDIEDISVYADFDRFKQIIVNLLKNAIQFTTDGEIKITASQTKEVTEIIISDTGIGMTEEQIENIWDRYYKADASRKNTKYGESGLGLPIVKQLVELHEGHIKVESTPGEGSTFTLIFPRIKAKDEIKTS